MFYFNIFLGVSCYLYFQYFFFTDDYVLLMSLSVGTAIPREQLILSMNLHLEIAKVLKKIDQKGNLVPLFQNPVFNNTASFIITDRNFVITLQYSVKNSSFSSDELQKLQIFYEATIDIVLLFFFNKIDLEKTLVAGKEIGSPELFSFQTLDIFDFNFPDEQKPLLFNLLSKSASICDGDLCTFIQAAYDKAPGNGNKIFQGESSVDPVELKAREEMIAFLKSDFILLLVEFLKFIGKE